MFPRSFNRSATVNSTRGRRSVPPFVRDLLARPPRHGDGVHSWLYKVARVLHHYRSPDDIVELLAAAVSDCGRVVPAREILAAVKNSHGCKWVPGRVPAASAKTAPKWPDANLPKIAEVVAATKVRLYDLWEASPVRAEGEAFDAYWYLNQLFPGNPLLCCGTNVSKFCTHPLEWFHGRLSTYSLIVPSAMSARFGKAKAGHMSEHTADNTGPRQYLVTESDKISKDQQAAVIWHLRQFAPLSLVVDSAGKSLHAWWDCRGTNEGMISRFFREAVLLGADNKMWDKFQFARLPEGWRDDKQSRQRVLYFDPESGKEPQP